MQEILEIRLGPMPGLALLAALALAGLGPMWRVLRALGRAPDLSSAPRLSLATDLTYLMVSPLTETLSRMLSTLGIAAGAVLLGRRVEPALLQGFGPIAQQPQWLIVLEMLVLSDFIYYWTHRLAHELPWLWRLHAVHHSTEHLRWTSALRAHPAEAYAHLVNTLPLFLLGFPVDALLPMAPLVTLYAMWIHTGQDVVLRRLSYVVNTPVFHGVHHARDVRDGTKNFAGFFPVFDVMFGTYHLPARAPRDTGIDDPHMPGTLAEQLVYPFRSHADVPAADGDGPLNVADAEQSARPLLPARAAVP